jgi:hypothetical protein
MIIERVTEGKARKEEKMHGSDIKVELLARSDDHRAWATTFTFCED